MSITSLLVYVFLVYNLGSLRVVCMVNYFLCSESLAMEGILVPMINSFLFLF